MINLEKIGQKIANLRKQNNMRQNELADALYVTHQAVSKWENGKSIPSIEVLYDLTKLFDVSIDYLLEDADIHPDDYETQLKHFAREAVIKKFLQEEKPEVKIDRIFYLLNKDERKRIINLIIAEKTRIQVEHVWHLLSKSERLYVLGVIVSKKKRYDISSIYNQLTAEEASLLSKSGVKGNISIHLP